MRVRGYEALSTGLGKLDGQSLLMDSTKVPAQSVYYSTPSSFFWIALRDEDSVLSCQLSSSSGSHLI